MALWPLEIFYSFGTGIDFRRQILTSKLGPCIGRANDLDSSIIWTTNANEMKRACFTRKAGREGTKPRGKWRKHILKALNSLNAKILLNAKSHEPFSLVWPVIKCFVKIKISSAAYSTLQSTNTRLVMSIKWKTSANIMWWANADSVFY